MMLCHIPGMPQYLSDWQFGTWYDSPNGSSMSTRSGREAAGAIGCKRCPAGLASTEGDNTDGRARERLAITGTKFFAPHASV